MNILFCTEKWCAANPTFGLTNNFHNLFNSFCQSRPEQFDTLHLDESSLTYGVGIDSVLLNYVERNHTNVIIFCLLGDSHLNPNMDTYLELKRRGIRTVFMWPDTSNWAINQIMALSGIADLSVSWDNPYSSRHNEIPYPENHVMMWVPQDTEMFRPTEQDICASFVGSIYQDRANFLRTLGSNVLISGGQRSGKLTPYDYARLIRRSKISINFAISPCQTYYQTKGRVYEVLASRSLLLESKNPSTAKLFTPGVDYVEFSTPQELNDAIEYYSNHEEERVRIASSGHVAYQKYNSQKFWDTIINKVAP